MNVDAIFDAVGRHAAYVVRTDKRGRKAAQLRSVQEKRCGNCYHWMKRSCTPEKQHGQFKSMNSLACKDFELDNKHGLIEKFKAELTVIDAELADMRRDGDLNEQTND